MTPIILNRNVQQVTLLGDILGLKPVVHTRAARLLGLQTSLMEPYVDKTIDLKLQYRMVSLSERNVGVCFHICFISFSAVNRLLKNQEDKNLLMFR